MAVFDNNGTQWCEKPLYIQLCVSLIGDATCVLLRLCDDGFAPITLPLTGEKEDRRRVPIHRTMQAASVRPRRRSVPVETLDVKTNRWTVIDAAAAVDRDELTVSTFNIWFNTFFADQRYRAIAQLLSRDMPDVMVFQEVTPVPLAVFLAQPWIREHYRCAAVTGGALATTAC